MMILNIYYFLGGVFIFATIWMYGCYRLSLHYELKHKNLILPDEKYEKLIINKIRKMNGRQFEEFCCFLFEMSGIKCELTPTTRDGGKDLILDGNTYVECKCYAKGNLCSTPMINKLLGACVSDGIQNGIFITTSEYSKDCYAMLERVNKNISLKLWNIYDLTDLCRNLDKEAVLRKLGYNASAIGYA